MHVRVNEHDVYAQLHLNVSSLKGPGKPFTIFLILIRDPWEGGAYLTICHSSVLIK
jgi:hypothetical protein